MASISWSWRMSREIKKAAADFQAMGAKVDALQADLATIEGVDKLYATIGGRPVDALLANAGRGLGKGFLDQDFDDVLRVINTNITGTIYLIQKVGRDMRARKRGQILITGSIAGFMPGHLPGGLQRQQGVPRFLLLRPARRDEGHRRDGHVPHAGRDRDRVL